MKILFIGHPGSGKTYVADLLNSKTGIEKVDIDTLFDKHPFYFLSKRLYRKALNRMLKDKKDWIMDGYHGKRLPAELWRSADVIIYLNIPKGELRKNVLSRYKTKKARKEFSHGQSTYINNLKNFGQIKFRDKSLKKNVEKIKAFKHDKTAFIELKSREDIKNFIDSFRVRK